MTRRKRKRGKGRENTNQTNLCKREEWKKQIGNKRNKKKDDKKWIKEKRMKAMNGNTKK